MTKKPPAALTFTLTEDGRLDKLLGAWGADHGLSRVRLQQIIRAGQCTRGEGAILTDPAHKMRAGDTVCLALPEAEDSPIQAEKIPLTIIYEDSHLIVLDKPAGLVVHPAPGHRQSTLVNALLAHAEGKLSGIGGVKRPGIVHRLDKDTSGLIVIAKNDAAHQALAAQFQDRSLSRTYRALCHGVPNPAHGRIDAPIGRDPRHRHRMAVTKTGKPAQTDYAVLKTFGPHAALVECRLQTGRTHQIRVHLKHIGHPLWGDAVYAGRRAQLVPFARQALHAAELKFRHPKTGKLCSFKADYPKDFKILIKELEKAANPPHIKGPRASAFRKG